MNGLIYFGKLALPTVLFGPFFLPLGPLVVDGVESKGLILPLAALVFDDVKPNLVAAIFSLFFVFMVVNDSLLAAL